MRKILSAREYRSLLQLMSPDEAHRAAEALAAAARELMDRHGLDRAVFLCDEPLREIGSRSAKILQASIAFLQTDELPDLADSLICDLLFSSDAAKNQKRETWIQAMIVSGSPILSASVPSGLDPDNGRAGERTVSAELTVSPGAYLSGLFLHDGLDHCGTIRPVGGETEAEEGMFRFEQTDADQLPPRKRTAHKGDSGRALLCVGSPKYVGAALLSARACLAAGCGILFVACPDAVRSALWRLPEAIGISVGLDWCEEACQKAVQALQNKKAIGIGCGVGDGDISPLLEEALRAKLPMVLDADGLNCLSRHPELYPMLHEKVILTPHPGEMCRLARLSVDQVLDDPAGVSKRFAALWGCIVLLKGAATAVSDGTRTCIVAEGNAGLGKGGSGDVLTGIITGLLAQGVRPHYAACLGSYLLGVSAQRAYTLLGERMLRASNVIEALKDRNE